MTTLIQPHFYRKLREKIFSIMLKVNFWQLSPLYLQQTLMVEPTNLVRECFWLNYILMQKCIQEQPDIMMPLLISIKSLMKEGISWSPISEKTFHLIIIRQRDNFPASCRCSFQPEFWKYYLSCKW